MSKPLRVLMVEDSEDDVLLTIHALKKGGYAPVHERVEDAEAMRKALETGSWDVILCDYQMPKFDAPAAIEVLKETGTDIPLIIVSGAIGEAMAVQCMRSGALDYVMKGNLSRLTSAVERELKEAESRRQRKRAEESLRESEENYRQLFDNSPAGIYRIDFRTGKFLKANDVICKYLGCSPEEITSRSPYDVLTDDSKQLLSERLRKIGIGEKVKTDPEYEIVDKNGKHRWLQLNSKNIYDAEGLVVGADVVAHEITDRKLAENETAKIAQEWQVTFDATNDAIWILDQDQKVFRSNKAAERFFHRPLKEMIGKHCWEIVHGTEQPLPECPILRVRKGLRRESMELQAGDRWFEVNIDPILDAAGRYSGAVHIVSDITYRKWNEHEMVLLSEIGMTIGSTLETDKVYEQVVADIRKLIPFDNMRINLINEQKETLQVVYVSGLDMPGRRIGESYPLRGTISDEIVRTRRGIIIQSENPEELVEKFPGLMVSVRAGMRSMMSVPLISRNELIGSLVMRSKKPVAYVERDLRLAERIGMQIAGAITNAQLFADIKRTETFLRESERRFRSLFEQAAVGVAEIAVETGRFITVNRRLCEIVGWTEEELLDTTFQAITHPDDSRLHEEKTQMIMSGQIDHFSMEKRYLRKDGGNVWANISVSRLSRSQEAPQRNMIVIEDITERKRVEEELKDTLESLRKAFGTTIQVLVSAVEVRDPYTSGHQLRSADLARAIAKEIGLPADKIEGLRMAGSIHDIGKLSIPAEILSKPTKLSEIEFSLIKAHSERGFEMLKNVESPWPLAEIIYQHHERMDGSGYPRHLKGEEILIEARILAVADVMEAMASHRPYRPGFGIDAALNEIEKNRGIFYDTVVADACLRLFREKGFQLATA